jgi:subtilisin family serine protease
MTVSIPTSETPTRILDVWASGNDTVILTLSGATSSLSGTPAAISFPYAYRSQPYGAVHVAAAGTADKAAATIDLDKRPLFPACYPSDLIVSVGGSTRPTTSQPDEFPTKVKDNFSNYGWHAVDLFAPGIDIMSTTASTATGYDLRDGTSAAAAQVSGAIALMRMVYPTAPDRQIVTGIISANDPRPGLTWFCRTGGRLNVHKAVTQPLP